MLQFLRNQRYLLLTLVIAVFAMSIGFTLSKLRSEFEVSASEYKPTLWYASQIEFEFSKLLSTLDH
ncbi:MAG: hypothetical protein EXQ96_05435 [Alphaproteobacteria bacterium]|nr:hypothetical protein [Alphaproteobacteria bacterium]